MKLSERRKSALDKCTQICMREYQKYLENTQQARDEYFAELAKIDGEADEIAARAAPSPAKTEEGE